MCHENLWGDLPKIDDVKTPLLILKEQAAQLGEMTNNILEAVISTPEVNPERPGFFYVNFYLVVPTMNYYRISILQMSFRINDIYPVFMFNTLTDDRKVITSFNEKEYKINLKNILSSDSVQKVISSLLSYAKAG